MLEGALDVPALCWPRLRLQLVPAHGRPALDTPMIDPSVPQETCRAEARSVASNGDGSIAVDRTGGMSIIYVSV